MEAPGASESIPYRIEIEDGAVVRCWEPRDAELLKDAVDSSLEHLRPWMPWAHDEPQSVEEKAALQRQFRGWFDLRQDFVYGIFSSDESEVLGGTGLHPRVGDGAFEIGLAASPAARVRLTAFDCRGLQVVAAEARDASRDAG